MTTTRTKQRERVRRTSSSIATGAYTSSVVATVGLTRGMPVSTSTAYHNPDGLPNLARGKFGEALMQRTVLREFLHDTGNWVSVPPRGAPQGIDGLFFRADFEGKMQLPLVVEAKYNTSRLGTTLDGRQMSDTWIRNRMGAPSETFAVLQWDDSESVTRHFRVPKDVEAIEVPLAQSQKAQVWIVNGEKQVCAPDGVSLDRVRSQLRQMEKMVDAVADGHIGYRARLFRYQVKAGQHVIEFKPVSKDGVPIHGDDSIKEIVGSGDEFPAHVRDGLENAFRKTFEAEGVPAKNAKALAKKCVEDPEYAKKIGLEARDGYITISHGAAQLAVVAGAAGLFSALGNAAAQYWQTGSIDLNQTARWAAAGVVSAGGAYVASAAFHWALVETALGRQIAEMMPAQYVLGQSVEKVMGTVGGALVGSALYVSTLYLLGEMGQKQAGRQLSRTAVQLLAAKGAGAAAVGGAAAFGSASTGTAISSLSGIAAQNATLAWWGGGSLASGGFGMAGGAMVLTGIGFVVGVAAIPAMGYIYKKMDEAEHRMTVEGKVIIVKDRVARGEQPEWRHQYVAAASA